MTLLWKVTLVLVVVLAVADSSTHYRHRKYNSNEYNSKEYKYDHLHNGEDRRMISLLHQNPGNLGEIRFEGHIYCHGNPLKWVKPYLNSPFYSNVIINAYKTNEEGRYTLTTGNFMDRLNLHGKERILSIIIRHRCVMKKLVPIHDCHMPFYTTNVKFDLSNNATYISRDFELSTMEAETEAWCMI